MKNPSHPELQVQEWLRRAEDDEKSIHVIVKYKEGAPNTACFLSQQMVEKLLKAYLISREQWFPKIHNLDTLWELCKKWDHSFEEIKDECIHLTAFYVTTRYPGHYPEFSFKDAQTAFKKALKIKIFIEERLYCP